MIKRIFIIPVGEGINKSIPHYPEICEVFLTFDDLLERILSTWVMERGELNEDLLQSELEQFTIEDLTEAWACGHLSDEEYNEQYVDKLLEHQATVSHYLFNDLKALFNEVAPMLQAGYELFDAHVIDSNDHDLYVEVTFRSGDRNAKEKLKCLTDPAHG